MKSFFIDLYHWDITGNTACTLTANTCTSANHAGPSVLIQNDQDEDAMSDSDTSYMAFDIYNMQGNDHVFKTLNSIATDSDHIPVICFEPGIARREGTDSRFITDKSMPLRAQMGDNQPAVCYTMNERQISMMVRNNTANTIAATDYKGVQIVCYESD